MTDTVKVPPEVLEAMKVVVNFMEDVLTTPVQEVLVSPVKKRKRKVKRLHYTDEERQQIRDLFTIGKSNRQIAKALGRTEAAIAIQCSVLGLTKKARNG